MNAISNESKVTGEAGPDKDGRGQLVGGAVMLFAGLVLLLGQLFSLGAWFLVLLGLGFTTAGVVSRAAGWFIPGGVLNGIGLGALLTESRLLAGERAEGGLFLLAFALGWASIYLLTRLFTAQPQGWALIPAAVMGLIGGALILGEPGAAALAAVLQVLAYVWPLTLVIAGVVVIARARRR